MRQTLPKGLRAWEVVRRLYILAVGAYSLTAFAFAGLSVRTLGTPGYTDAPWQNGSLSLTEAFAFIAGLLVVSYFLIVAWFAKRHDFASFVHAVHSDDTLKRSRVDAFNWSLYAVIVVYGVLYVVISACFGEVY